MEASLRGARRPEALDGGSSDAVWGVTGVMAKDILPDERRRRNRLCALRALERLGLLGEENLIPTLARRPELRWLADEEGGEVGRPHRAGPHRRAGGVRGGRRVGAENPTANRASQALHLPL